MATTLSTNQTGFRPASSLKIFFRKSLNLIGYEKKISGTTRIVFLFKAFVISCHESNSAEESRDSSPTTKKA